MTNNKFLPFQINDYKDFQSQSDWIQIAKERPNDPYLQKIAEWIPKQKTWTKDDGPLYQHPVIPILEGGKLEFWNFISVPASIHFELYELRNQVYKNLQTTTPMKMDFESFSNLENEPSSKNSGRTSSYKLTKLTKKGFSKLEGPSTQRKAKRGQMTQEVRDFFTFGSIWYHNDLGRLGLKALVIQPGEVNNYVELQYKLLKYSMDFGQELSKKNPTFKGLGRVLQKMAEFERQTQVFFRANCYLLIVTYMQTKQQKSEEKVSSSVSAVEKKVSKPASKYRKRNRYSICSWKIEGLVNEKAVEEENHQEMERPLLTEKQIQNSIAKQNVDVNIFYKKGAEWTNLTVCPHIVIKCIFPEVSTNAHTWAMMMNAVDEYSDKNQTPENHDNWMKLMESHKNTNRRKFCRYINDSIKEFMTNPSKQRRGFLGWYINRFGIEND